jgi:hypothetical protein
VAWSSADVADDEEEAEEREDTEGKTLGGRRDAACAPWKPKAKGDRLSRELAVSC